MVSRSHAFQYMRVNHVGDLAINTFKSMSNLVADAQDLLKTLGESSNSDVLALKKKVEASIEEVREQARRQIKTSACFDRKTGPFEAAHIRYNPALVWALGVGAAVTIASWLLTRQSSG